MRSTTLAYMIREATLDDIPAMQRIRDGVRENRLVSITIDHAAYVQAISVDGRAWVYVTDDDVVGFVCGRTVQADIWGLFVLQNHEGRGIGNALMAVVEPWLFAQGLAQVQLTTEPGTRAERLYRRRGWVCDGTTSSGELAFSLNNTPPR